MNNLYVACLDCKIYIDAGYRWAYWELEDAGIVSRHAQVYVDAVLAAESYWNPPKEELSRWLYEEVFPPLRQFLNEHKGHQLVFGEDEDFAPDYEDYVLNWMQIGYLLWAKPRYFVEVLGYETWDEVNEYMKGLTPPPTWWDVHSGFQEKGQQKFEELVKKKHGS